MQIKQVDHLSINVSDVDESIRFYGEVLGLPRLPSVRMADHDLYYFQLGGGMRLELIAYDKKASALACDPESPGMYRHMALQVSNISAWEAHLMAQGVRVTSASSWVPALQSTNMLIQDPNGVEIELLEKQ